MSRFPPPMVKQKTEPALKYNPFQQVLKASTECTVVRSMWVEVFLAWAVVCIFTSGLD